jgi:hypothetical protein
MSTITDNASLTPRRRGVTANQPIQTPTTTPVPYMTVSATQIRRFLTKVAVNELGDCPGSESDDDEENPYQGFYMYPLVSEDPRKTHYGISLDNVTIEEEDDVAYVEQNFADGEVESHHGLYWKRDGVLEQPQRKMPKTIGKLKPQFVKNFGNPIDSIMSIFPLIYWKIISRETNDNAPMKLEQQFTTT